jgi:hypothetical protein
VSGDGAEAAGDALDPAQLLGLPERARLSERLTKRMLRDQVGGGEGATPESKLIDKAVASARVVGILRPETVLVPAHREQGSDGTSGREVTDIVVLHIQLAPDIAPVARRRLVELIQRAMPRPVVLFLDGPGQPAELALALTHISRADPEKRTSVIDEALTIPVDVLPANALDISRCDRADLWALYRDLVRIAACGGRPAAAALSAEEAVRLRRRLAALHAELGTVTREAKRANSQQMRISLNTTAKTLRRQIATVSGALYSFDSAQ